MLRFHTQMISVRKKLSVRDKNVAAFLYGGKIFCILRPTEDRSGDCLLK